MQYAITDTLLAEIWQASRVGNQYFNVMFNLDAQAWLGVDPPLLFSLRATLPLDQARSNVV
jgi:hypothetical protein